MDNSVKREFTNWINKLDKPSLSDIDIKLLNIIINNFDSLVPLGTHGGKRAKKLSELILEFKDTISPILEENSTEQKTEINQIGKLSGLKIGPFRGFVSQEYFDFDKKYTFLYGPNGSGKSSFFEGLEYALIGDISEATAKRIPLETYIKNIEKNKYQLPIVYYLDKKGEKQKIIINQERYRFSLIEKNRIDNFARISATTPNEQKDRIASLFGLDNFSNFVDGFTDNFQQLSTDTPKADNFSATNKEIELKKQRKIEIEKELDQNIIAVNELVKEVGEKDIENKEKLNIFLNGIDGTSGKITQLIKKQLQTISEDINTETLDKISMEANEIHSITSSLNTDFNDFQNYSSTVNYKELYSAIVAIDKSPDSIKTVCPACKTPIEQTAINPFLNAQNELNKLQKLTSLQERIQNTAKNIEQKIRSLNLSIIEIENILSVISYEKALTKITEIMFTDITTISSWLDKLTKEIAIIKDESDKYFEIKKLIDEHNKTLEHEREEQNTIDNAIKKYSSFNTRLTELNAIEKMRKDEIELINTEICNFNINNEHIIQEIDIEKKQVEENKKYIDSYTKLITLLKKYRNDLPISFATGLSGKVKEYYNAINDHDTDFEKLSSISLPSISGNKIMIQFLDNPNDSYDALYVLSEGHIRILGLSILLAKAVAEGLEFIVFDDIVNAIDDDHRSGIAELLMNNSDFQSREQIITCHGEMFIKLLEHKLGANETQKKVRQYRFFPSDLMLGRGIRYSPSDSMHNIMQARQHLEKNELKNTAAKCRQAIENIAENIWGKIGKQIKGDLSVTMRSPDARPDLSSVVDSLIKKIGHIGKNSNLYIHLSELKAQYQWVLLNKGIHEQENLPEFERKEIRDLLGLIETIEKDAKNFMMQVTIISDNTQEV